MSLKSFEAGLRRDLPSGIKLKTPCCGQRVRIPLYKFATYIGDRKCKDCGIRWLIRADVILHKPNFGMVHEISWTLHPKTEVIGVADKKNTTGRNRTTFET